MNDEDIQISPHEMTSIHIMEDAHLVSGEQCNAVSENDSIVDDCCLLDDMTLILRKQENMPVVDVDQQLKAFHSAHHSEESSQESPKRCIFYLTVLTLAASLLLLFVLKPTAERHQSVTGKQIITDNDLIVYQATESDQRIIVESGETIIPVDDKSLGAQVSETSIRYPKMSDDKDIPGELETHKVTIPWGRTFTICLSDGTEVFLNASSSLLYPTYFTGKERIVSLKGEAYFKVARDTSHPFIVKCGNTRTTVLGTEFNIRERQGEPTRITLIKGSVRVSTEDHSVKQVTMTPGQQATYDTQHPSVITLADIDIDPYIYWKEGYFYFDGISLRQIMREIGNWYNMSVEFRNPTALDTEIHFVGERKAPIEKTIALLNDLEKVHISIDNGKLIVE